MGLGHSPSIITSNLVMCLDAANYKSFKGVPATNILNQITYTQGNTNTALFKYTQGTENVNIPSIGYVNSKFVDIYNDYNGGSGICCPSLFTFGSGATMVVSPSTTYTYSIIYKTTTGYSHPNYMYRYERNSAGTVLTEAGVHSTNNRTSLGDGWWFAWGQFTTQATTAYLDTYLFHYEYATQNRVYVYKAALYAGTYIIPPEHMLNSAEVRGATVATGGGWADLIGNGNNGTLTNGPTYSSLNGGSIVFDGTNDYISLDSPSSKWDWTPSGGGNNTLSFDMWVKSSDTGGHYFSKPWNGNGEYNYYLTSNGWHSNVNPQTHLLTFTNLATGNWEHICCIITPTQKAVYRNGVIDASFTNHGITANTPQSGNANLPLAIMTVYPYGEGWSGLTGHAISGNVSSFKIYNRVLTAAEVAQNFNATRGRYGV